MADMHRLGDVGRAEVDDTGLRRRDLGNTEAFILGHRLKLSRHPIGPQAQIDEPWAGDLWFLQLIAEVETVNDFLCYVARLLTENLGEAHGAVGLIVAVFGILRRPDHG